MLIIFKKKTKDQRPKTKDQRVELIKIPSLEIGTKWRFRDSGSLSREASAEREVGVGLFKKTKDERQK
jgi:hypothetical protein